MKIFIIALLLAIGYAQTVCTCNNGEKAGWRDCTGGEHCLSCDDGFTLDGKLCTVTPSEGWTTLGSGVCTFDNGDIAAANMQYESEYNYQGTIEDCKAACIAQGECKSVEYKPDRCVYTYGSGQPITKADGSGGFFCLKYEASSSGGSASSHGDPIIWTFKGDCYDLNKDGLYLASSHPDYDHKVYVAVYNEFIRELQIRNSNNDLLFSVSNMNELSGQWNYGLKYFNRICGEMSWKECELFFHQYAFDAQIFRYTVQIMFHDYLDPALKEGERGIHLDIYPVVYKKRLEQFVPDDCEGIYFDNPYPEELPYCPAESERREL